MFSSTIHQLPCLPNFEGAHKYFEATKKPRSARWADNQRPLKDTRSTHYRIERHERYGEVFYDLVLYSTSMARYYAPDADDNRTSLYMWHDSVSSRDFMYHVVGNSPKLLKRQATDNRILAVPYAASETIKDHGTSFTCKLVMDSDKRIDVANSWHPQMYRFVETAADKAVRLAFEKEVENVLLLSAMRLQDYEREFKYISHTDGFSKMETKVRIGDLYKAHGFDGPFIQGVFEMSQDVYNFLRSKRHIMAGGQEARYRYVSGASCWDDPDTIIGERVTEKDFIKTLKGHVLTRINMKLKRGAVRLPKWMPYDDYPGTVASGFLRGATVLE